MMNMKHLFRLGLLFILCNQAAAETKSIAPAAIKAVPDPGAVDLYVNPETGSDTANGRSAEIKAGNGPFKTIARAIATAKPGDTIHLAPMTYTNECVVFRNKSGEPGKPITLDGHGAVIDGSDPLIERDWHEVGPGLYRNTDAVCEAAVFRAKLLFRALRW